MRIASCLIDTNVLLRLSRRSDPQHQLAATVLERLAQQGTALHYTLQNIAELWNVMTRPLAHNGFGLSVSEADLEVRVIEAGLSLLPDRAAAYPEWREIIVERKISGVQVHDARLAAAMYVHNVRHILTFNTADFARSTGLMAVHPGSI